MTTIDLETVNRFCLRKQHLTDDTRSSNLLTVVNDIGGLHATCPTTPYLSLLARAKDFVKEDLEDLLYQKRDLVRMPYVRCTVFLLRKEWVPIAHAATGRIVKLARERFGSYLGVTAEDYDSMSKVILDLLSGRGMTTRDIKKALETKIPVSPIVSRMCDEQQLVRGEPRGGWRSNIHIYHRFDEYLPDLKLTQMDEGRARTQVVKHYLSSFGPTSVNDIVWWTRFPKKEVSHILEDLGDNLIHVDVSGIDNELIILGSEEPAFLSNDKRDTPTLRLLPVLDPYLMGYKERDRFFERGLHDRIYDRGGNTTSTIMLEGRVVGVWDLSERPKPVFKLHFFDEVPSDILERVNVTARGLSRFITGGDVPIVECESMAPLTSRSTGSFMSPLRE